MSDLSPSGRGESYWPDLGRQLAALHQHTHTKYGFAHDNYIGSTPQPNPWMEDGFAFFAEQRLWYMTELGRERNLMAVADAQKVEKLISLLPDLVPAQPASLIHGDLWSGNITSDAKGNPANIDPATHYGWAEAELAMMTLFGSFPEDFIRSYLEIRPLEPGFRARFSIYNLYHLLNHLNIFGRSYLGQVQSILRKYT
jgi:fructosamine-3-kinase